MLECLHPDCGREFSNKTGRNIHFSYHDDCEKIALELLSDADNVKYDNCSDKVGLSSVFYEKRFGSWNNALTEAGLEVWDRTGEDNPCWRGGKTEHLYSCEFCYNLFLGNTKDDRTFCSYDCKADWQRENFTGENNPSSWSKSRKRARERANYVCEHPYCNKTVEDVGRNLDVHHIVPFRYFDSHREANKLDNLILLCPTHHKTEERRIWNIESIQNS